MELTLELLAKRVEVLEQQLAKLTTRNKMRSTIHPPTGTWEEATEAARRLREDATYDFDAYREQREIDLQDAIKNARAFDE